VDSLRVAILSGWCLAPINGLLCVLIHWLIWPRPPENDR
jgi:hypothetical protein